MVVRYISSGVLGSLSYHLCVGTDRCCSLDISETSLCVYICVNVNVIHTYMRISADKLCLFNQIKHQILPMKLHITNQNFH